ncbi:MAG: enoyl-CoA hydratase/isomerase family protein [Acidimicrobiales bacterium]
MTGSLVQVVHDDHGVAVVTLNRPKVNALSRALLEELYEVATELAETPPGALILTGGPKIFAAGADISEFGGAEIAYEVSGLFHRTTLALESISCITIAAINGVALGGGCELALSCDLRLMGDESSLGQPEILLGIIPGGGGTQRLGRLVGPSRAKDIVMSGRMIAPDEALSMGMVNRVVAEADVQDAALSLAQRYAAGPRRAQALAKQVIDAGLGQSLTEALQRERDAFKEVFDTEDARIGIDSFLEHGPGKANFVGK